MIYTSQEKDGIIIFSGKVTRELLRRGFTVIDVKPDKKNKIKSVFVFKRENDIERILADITYKETVEIF